MEVAVPGFHGGDRIDITLPDPQRRLLRAVASLGKPVILVLLNGSALALPEISMVPAVIEAWYPGQAGGTAVAEILFGDVNPSGRLPVTFYRETGDIPPFADYSMEGRTYRFFEGKPLFPFGHGLSYTSFAYANTRLSRKEIPPSSGDTLWVSVDIANRGERDGEEVVQLYLRAVESSVPRPVKELRGFQRVSVKKGETATVRFGLQPKDVAYFNPGSHAWMVEKGEYEVLIGASSGDIRERVRFSIQ